jgi:hypothetical protein
MSYGRWKISVQKKEVHFLKEKIQDFYRNGGMYHELEIFDEEPAGRELW